MKYGSYQPRSQFMRLEQGENKVRLLTEPEQFTSVYNDKETTRFVAYVIDRKDGEIKPFTFGASIIGQIALLANGTEYGFTDTPPYDIIINKKGSDLATEYTVSPARKDTPLTKAETDALAELAPITELAAKLDKRLSGGESRGTPGTPGTTNTHKVPNESFVQDESEISVSDIPF